MFHPYPVVNVVRTAEGVCRTREESALQYQLASMRPLTNMYLDIEGGRQAEVNAYWIAARHWLP